MNRVQPVDFIFKIATSDGVFPIKDSPIGWKEYGTAWERHKERHGYGRKFVTELQFVGDGFDLLRAEYEKYGVEAEASLEIHRLDRATYLYHLDFVGDIDFSQGTFNLHHGNSYEVQINEAGFAKMLGAKAKDKYEIALLDTILIDKPANALEEANWSWVSENDRSVTPEVYEDMCAFTAGDILSNYVEARTRLSTGAFGEETWILAVSDIFVDENSEILSTREKEYALRFAIQGSVVFEKLPTVIAPDLMFAMGVVRLPYVQDPNGNYTFNGRKYRMQLSWLTDIISIPVEQITAGVPVAISAETLNPNLAPPVGTYCEYRTFATVVSRTPPYTEASGYKFVFEGKFNAGYVGDPITVPFEVKAIRAYDLYTELISRIAEDVPLYGIPSRLLTEGIMREVYVTSGDAVRGIASAVVKTSFNEFFESVDKVCGAALFIQQSPVFDDDRSYVVSMEAYGEAYRNTEIMDLGEVKNLSITPDSDSMYNYVKVGSPNKEYKASNGRFEFNTENDFALPLTRVTDEKSFIPVYRTDSFGITDLRYSYEKQSTAASESDNNVWFMHTKLNSNGVRIPYDDQEIIGDALQRERTGVFNLLFTSKRCLIRQEGRIASMLQKIAMPLASYRTTTKTDAVLTSRLLGEYMEAEPVVELSDYIIDVEKAITLAEVHKFTCVVPINLATFMSRNVGGYVAFSYQGVRYAGFPEYVSETPAENSPQEVKLIAKKI